MRIVGSIIGSVAGLIGVFVVIERVQLWRDRRALWRRVESDWWNA